MIGLYMFGPVVELTLGSRRFTLFYFLCGIAGPVMYAILYGVGILGSSERGEAGAWSARPPASSAF